MRITKQRIGRVGGPWRGPAAAALCALACLAGCGEEIPYGGQGTVVSETPAEANGVLSCEDLAGERGALARSLSQLTTADDATELRARQSALAALATAKHCPGS